MNLSKLPSIPANIPTDTTPLPTEIPAVNNSVLGTSSDKQNTNETLGQKINSIKNFVIYLATFIASILLYFVFGIGILYITKVFQSNIIPDELNCFPYTNEEANLKELSVDPLININRIYSPETQAYLSEKVKFGYLQNKNTAFLNKQIHKISSIYEPDEHLSGLYYWLCNTFQRFYYCNMFLMSGFFSLINALSFGYDFLILLLGPALFGLYLVFTLILVYPMYIYSFVSSLYLVSCKNKSTKETPNTWEPQISRNATFFMWVLNILYLMLWFLIAVCICIPPLAQALIVIMTLIIIIAGLVNINGEKIIDEKTREPYGFADFFKDTLKYKSWFFMAILTVGVVAGLPQFFDSTTSVIVTFVLILLVIFELMGFNYNPLPIYSQIQPEYLSAELKKLAQVDKIKCKQIKLNYVEKTEDLNQKGFMEGLLDATFGKLSKTVDLVVDWLANKGLMIFSLTPPGRAANLAVNMAEKVGPSIVDKLVGSSSLFGNASNASLLPQPAPLIGSTPGTVTLSTPVEPKVSNSAAPPASNLAQKPVKPVKPIGKRRGGGGGVENDYSQLAKTLKKIINEN